MTETNQGQILQLLKAAKGQYVSGALLASRLGLTRTGIWKHIQTLKSEGYVILSHPKEGYCLMEVPDRLTPEEILPALRTAWLGRTYHYFDQVSSTNDLALQGAVQGYPHGTVIVAEEQTQGRGRLKRPWLSSARRGIYLSILIRTPFTLQEAARLTSLTALAVAKTLRDRYQLPARIKWPNDILIHGKKVAGILIEMQSDQEVTRFLVIGVGINVNYTKDDLKGSFRYAPTSLALELETPVQRQELLLAFFQQFEKDFEQMLREGFATMAPDLKELSAILGKRITVHSARGELSGEAVGFTAEGALEILTDRGKKEVIWVGDVTRVEGDF